MRRRDHPVKQRIVTGILGLLINLVFRAIERHSLSWHQSVRGEEVL